jgi:hypothetical protein
MYHCRGFLLARTRINGGQTLFRDQAATSN